MGLGLGFCCCKECIILDDTFDRETLGDDWTVDAGSWSIASGKLTTSTAGSKITCNVEPPDYPYSVIPAYPAGSTDWKIHLGSDTVIEVKQEYGQWEMKVSQGSTVYLDAIYNSIVYYGIPALIVVDGSTLYVFCQSTQAGFEGYTYIPWRFELANAIGKSVAIEAVAVTTFTLSEFILANTAADCYPQDECSGWTTDSTHHYTPPLSATATLHAHPVATSDSTYQLPYVRSAWAYTTYDSFLTSPTGCIYFYRAGVAPDPNYGVFFRVVKISSSVYRAQGLYVYRVGDATQTRIFLGYQKDYSDALVQGWSDDLPLVCTGQTISAMPDDLSALGWNQGMWAGTLTDIHTPNTSHSMHVAT